MADLDLVLWWSVPILLTVGAVLTDVCFDKGYRQHGTMARNLLVGMGGLLLMMLFLANPFGVSLDYEVLLVLACGLGLVAVIVAINGVRRPAKPGSLWAPNHPTGVDGREYSRRA